MAAPSVEAAPPTAEAAVAAAAARQHGVVTRDQLIAAGLTEYGIRSQLRTGRLLPLHRCVYLLGSLVGPLCPARHREMAGVLAGGPEAAVGHRSALWLLELLPTRPGAVHLVLLRGRCRRPGVVAHRVDSLPRSDIEVVDGIRTTTPIRSILDTAGHAHPREIEQVIARAERLGRLDLDALRDRVSRQSGRRGIAILRAILARGAPAFTRSPAEDELLALVRKADLPEPACNVTVKGFELDMYWPDLRVAVEVDGFAYHGARRAFHSDRARDLALAAEGIEVLRVTWRHVAETPLVVVRRLSAVLARADAERERLGREIVPASDHGAK